MTGTVREVTRNDVAGLLLAAGQGRRMGLPKALVHAADGSSWLRRSRARLLDAGCVDVLTVLGAGAEQAAPLIDGGWRIEAEDWAEGIGASLRAGLRELSGSAYDGALVHLVDVPDVGADVMRRILNGGDQSSLKRATYGGAVGHPVLLGREHWAPLIDTLSGDTGANGYLRRWGVKRVECGDLATGRDVDTAEGI